MPSLQSIESMEFSVYSSQSKTNFFDIFSRLDKELEPQKWKEIKSRSNSNDEMSILVEAAMELSNSNAQAALFRKHSSANETLIAIWSSRIWKEARNRLLLSKIKPFAEITPDIVRKIAIMSSDIKSPTYIVDYLKDEFGIILVIDRGFSGMKLDGLATKLPSGNPVIGLSLRYPRYNYFWFTLLHELSHVCMHYWALDTVIYDDILDIDESEIEKEANRLASDSTIPRHIFNKTSAFRNPTEANLRQLAIQAQVHPALVAGMIQHQTKKYHLFSDIVNEINVREMLGVE